MKERVDAVLSYLNSEMIQRNRKITFNVDKATGLTVVTVLDLSDGKVIQQIPADEILKLSDNLASLKGLIFDDTQ
jgi:flagellar protein FlaG